MNADGSDQHRFTPPTFYWNESRPAWSPDGKRVVFQADRDAPLGNTELYAMNLDGGNLERLTSYPGKDDWPAWSPDGTRIAFARGPSPFQNEVYVMNADGSSTHEVTLPKLNGVMFAATPSPPLAGKRFRLIYDIIEASGADRVSPKVACSASLASKKLQPSLRTFNAYSGRAVCGWALGRAAHGERLIARIAVTGPAGTISKQFNGRVR
jgi:dipeptidyl aminopeptidase/acylaminoacyl peptidase